MLFSSLFYDKLIQDFRILNNIYEKPNILPTLFRILNWQTKGLLTLPDNILIFISSFIFKLKYFTFVHYFVNHWFDLLQGQHVQEDSRFPKQQLFTITVKKAFETCSRWIAFTKNVVGVPLFLDEYARSRFYSLLYPANFHSSLRVACWRLNNAQLDAPFSALF